MEEKFCLYCKENKSKDEFTKNKNTKDGLEVYCIPCRKIKYQLNKEKVLAARKDYYERNQETVKERRRNYVKNNPDKAKKSDRDSYKKNRDKRLEKARKLHHENREENNKARHLRRKEEIRRNPVLRMRLNIGRMIHAAFVEIGKKKDNSVTRALPYTIDELRKHIESQFDENMTWENYGSYWHLDHIIPKSLLIYDSLEHPNFKKCWSLENLRPLEKSLNLKKAARIDEAASNKELLKEILEYRKEN